MAKHNESDTDDRSGRADERARAAAYLDLWERQVTHAAINGPAPLPPLKLRAEVPRE